MRIATVSITQAQRDVHTALLDEIILRGREYESPRGVGVRFTKSYTMVVYQWPDARFDFFGKDSFFAEGRKWEHIRYAQYHMQSGLVFLRQLFAADITTQRELVLASLNQTKHSLGFALSARINSSLDEGSDISTTSDDESDTLSTSDDGSGSSVQSEDPFIDFDDDAGYPNAAWEWRRFDLDPSPFAHGAGDSCGKWGYVFWDHSRLELSGVLSKMYVIVPLSLQEPERGRHEIGG